jgi:hypothetical protein
MSCAPRLRCSLWLLAASLACGCAVERSSLSIDSNSRVPFMGLQLAPPKKKEPVYQRSISRDRAAQSEAAVVRLAQHEPRTESRWTDWLTPSPPRVSQPLPRTETPASDKPDVSGAVAETDIEF